MYIFNFRPVWARTLHFMFLSTVLHCYYIRNSDLKWNNLSLISTINITETMLRNPSMRFFVDWKDEFVTSYYKSVILSNSLITQPGE